MRQKVQGFGGLFFRAKDPGALSQWYEEHLGIPAVSAPDIWRQEAGPTVFAPFPADPEYFGHPGALGQTFLLNFRVKDLDAMVAQLEADGIEIVKRSSDVIGSFAWLLDPEGNTVELWQPSDETDWVVDGKPVSGPSPGHLRLV